MSGGGSGGGDPASSESASLVRHATNPFMSYTESSATPAGPEGAATPGERPAQHGGATGGAPLADTAEIDTEDSVLSQFHEDAIQQVRRGAPSAGLLASSDSVEAQQMTIDDGKFYSRKVATSVTFALCKWLLFS